MKNICSKVKGKLFVLDNGQIHKKESTKKIIKESGNYLVYTCPYHPRLNSIEQFFNQMKHYIKLDKPNTFTVKPRDDDLILDLLFSDFSSVPRKFPIHRFNVYTTRKSSS